MPTANPVPSQDPSDLLFNAGKLDEVVSGSNATYTDRLGISRRTMAGIDAAADVVLGGLGYAPPVAYASGIALTLTTQTVEYSGEVYAPKLANLPFTTTTWATDSSKFRLIQGVAATDLAASGGASMIGYMPAGTGAVATDVEEKLRELESQEVIGNPSTSYNLVGVALRRDTTIDPDWFLISDTAHIPINVSDVSLVAPNLQMSYTGEKIGTMIIAPDETLAADGATAGASVGADFCNISMGAPCSFVIDFDDSNAITFSSKYFDASRFSVSVGGGGLLTITHPERRLMQMPVIQHTASTSNQEGLTVHNIKASATSLTTCWLLGQAEGLISYSGSQWAISSSSWTTGQLTFSFNSGTGVLAVTHPTIVGSAGIYVTPWDNGGDIVCHVASVSATGFTAKFRKLDGTVPSLSTALGFYFSRGVSAFRITPTGKLHVDLGYVQVNMAHVDVTGGNLWTLGVMEK